MTRKFEKIAPLGQIKNGHYYYNTRAFSFTSISGEEYLKDAEEVAILGQMNPISFCSFKAAQDKNLLEPKQAFAFNSTHCSFKRVPLFFENLSESDSSLVPTVGNPVFASSSCDGNGK